MPESSSSGCTDVMSNVETIPHDHMKEYFDVNAKTVASIDDVN